MKSLAVAALGALVLASSPSAPSREAPASDSASLKETLVNLEKQSWVAWKGRDGKFFQGFLSEDHVEVGFGGPTDKANVVAGVGSAACVVETYTLDKFTLTAFDASTALLTYYADQKTLCGGKPVPRPVWASSLYLKRGGRWQNAMYQQTRTSAP